MNSEILRLSEIYGAARRLKESSVSTYATGSGDMLSRLRGTDERRPADITTRRAARIIQWLADNWPADAPWPPDIPRPSPSPGAPAARPEGAAPDAPAEGPVAYVRACRDRRLDRIDAGDWEGAKAIQLDMMRVAERLRADGRIACPMALAVALGVPRKVVDDTIRRYRDGRDGGAPRRRSRYDDALAALARSGDVRFASRRLKGAA